MKRPRNKRLQNQMVRFTLESRLDLMFYRHFLVISNFGIWGVAVIRPKRLFENRWIDGEFTTPTLIVSEDSKTTAETGLNEIVVGIITRQPIEIAPEQMGASRSSISTRGFQSVEEVKRVVLSDLPESDWAWCMLETEVKR